MRYDPQEDTSKLIELGPSDLGQVIAAIDRTILEVWMQHRYGMPMSYGTTMALVYARIYEASRSSIGVYCESQGNLARSIERSRRQVVECLRRLLELGLIAEVGCIGNPKTGIKAYRVCPGPINECIRAHALEVARQIEEGTADKAPDLSELVLYERPVTGAQTERVISDDKTAAEAAKAVAQAASAALKSAVPAAAQDAPATASEDTSNACEHADATACQAGAAPANEATPKEGSGTLSESEERAFDEIASEWPKKTSGDYLERAREEFKRLLEQRHTAADVTNACYAYLDDFFDPTRPAAQRNPRFVKHLNKFLSEPDGVRAWLRYVGDSGADSGGTTPCGDSRGVPCDESGMPAHSFARITSMGSSSWLATVTYTGECFELALAPDATRDELDRAFIREARRRGIVGDGS